ncbi:MAG: C4-dicarboxylate ABC transporter, partial [Pseudomonadota bacterium]
MAVSERTAEEIAAEVDTGARALTGSMSKAIPTICFVWSVYQLYIASPIPSLLTEHTGVSFFYFIGSLSISRKIHLAFAVILACMAYPMLRSSPRNKVPWYDWLLLVLGVGTILYMLVMNSHIAERAGNFTHDFIPIDMTVALIGVFVLTLC